MGKPKRRDIARSDRLEIRHVSRDRGCRRDLAHQLERIHNIGLEPRIPVPRISAQITRKQPKNPAFIERKDLGTPPDARTAKEHHARRRSRLCSRRNADCLEAFRGTDFLISGRPDSRLLTGDERDPNELSLAR